MSGGDVRLGEEGEGWFAVRRGSEVRVSYADDVR